MSDPFARRLAAAALAVGLVALVLAAYSVVLGLRYLEDVRTLGRSLGREVPAAASSLGPPLQLDAE